MRKLILLLCCLLLLPSVCTADGFFYGASAGCTVSCTGLAVCQDFETTVESCTTCIENKAAGAGTETWTASSQVEMDYATSPAPLHGTQSVWVNSSSYGYYTSFAEASEIWSFYRFYPEVVNDAAILMKIQNGTTVLAKQLLYSDGKMWAYSDAVYAASTAVATAAEMCVWAHWKKGAGSADGTYVQYFDECADVCTGGVCTRPASPDPAEGTNGGWDSSDADATVLLFTGDNTNELIVDQVYLSVGASEPAFWTSVCD